MMHNIDLFPVDDYPLNLFDIVPAGLKLKSSKGNRPRSQEPAHHRSL